MADRTYSIDPDMVAGDEQGSDVAPGSTSGQGRRALTVGLAAFVVVAVLAGGLFFLFGRLSPAPSSTGIGQGPDSAVAQTSQPAAPVAATDPAPPEPAKVGLTEVFTFRDIFVPLIVPKAAEPETPAAGSPGSGAGDGSTTTSGTATVSEGTLLLQDITVVDGERVAVLVWGDATYELGEGEPVPDSPWKVLEVRANSVVMQYGDQQVVLSVGQSVSK